MPAVEERAPEVAARVRRGLKIAICIPFYRIMDTQAVQSLIVMLSEIHNRGDVYVPVVCQHMYIDKARAFLVKAVLENVPSADYVLCIDTDHVYDARALYTLIERIEDGGLDMLSAAYVGRGRPSMWVHLKSVDGAQPTAIPVGSVSGIVECDVIGFGFSVFKVAMLKALWARHGLGLFAGGYEAGKVHIGDDVRFCELAREAGYKIAFDAGVKVGHISNVVL